jgi:hypothetical protein
MVTSFKFVLEDEYTILFFRDEIFIGRLNKYPGNEPCLVLYSRSLTMNELEMCLNKLKEFVG